MISSMMMSMGGPDEDHDIMRLSRQELIGKLWKAQANIKLRDKTNQDPGSAT